MTTPPERLRPLTVPRLPVRRPHGPRLAILWPAWQWQVVIPEGRVEALDLIERAVLGLIGSGRREAVDIASFLALDPGVVELVLANLMADGLVAKGEVTAAGRAALLGREERQREGESRTAFLFADPFTSKLWPVAPDRRPLDQVVERPTFHRAVVAAGTRGASEDVSCLVVEPPPRAVPRQPEPLRVLEAVREGDAGGDPWAIRGDAQGAVSYPHARPQLVHLLTYVYVAGHGFIDRPWEVVDPFGGRYLPGLRASVELAMAHSAPLAGEIEMLVARGAADLAMETGAAEPDRIESAGGGELGDLRARQSELERELAAMTRDAQSVRSGGRSKLIRKVERFQEDVARLAESALEYALDGRPARPWLDADRVASAAVVAELAESLGFSGVMPASVSSATRAQVEIALRGGQGSLRALTVASLFSAHEHADHPLRRVATTAPALPRVLLGLADARERPWRMPALQDQVVALTTELGNASEAVNALKALVLCIYEQVDASVSSTMAGERG